MTTYHEYYARVGARLAASRVLLDLASDLIKQGDATIAQDVLDRARKEQYAMLAEMSAMNEEPR